MELQFITIFLVLFEQALNSNVEANPNSGFSWSRFIPFSNRETKTNIVNNAKTSGSSSIISPLPPQAGDSLMSCKSPAVSQLINYAATHVNNSELFAQTVSGIVYPTLTASQTVGPQGPLLLQDSFFIEKIQLFNRERIPERIVHAVGSGAFGYFEVTHDISKYTKANFLQLGKRTNVAVRFSGGTGELGSPDTYPDPRGLCVKFYTEEGIHDLVGINYPIFAVSDAMAFTDFVRSRKRNPQTHLSPDITSTLDMLIHRPEITLFILFFLSDMSNPKSYRCMKGFTVHAFKMVNSHGEAVFVKFHWRPNQKEEFFTLKEAVEMFAKNPNILTQDLFDSIAKKDFPSWTLSIQVMTLAQADSHYHNPFDATKLWKEEEYPLIPVGKMTLNKNPENYFAQVEQIAFCPSNMVRGIEPSADRLLHGRFLAYRDSQFHRLGANFAQIPVNSCPFQVHTYHRDGPMNVGTNGGPTPNYFPNSFHGLNSNENRSFKQHVYSVSGNVDRIESSDNDSFSLPKYQWENHIRPDERKRIVENVVAYFRRAARSIQERAVNEIISNISEELADEVRAILKL